MFMRERMRWNAGKCSCLVIVSAGFSDPRMCRSNSPVAAAAGLHYVGELNTLLAAERSGARQQGVNPHSRGDRRQRPLPMAVFPTRSGSRWLDKPSASSAEETRLLLLLFFTLGTVAHKQINSDSTIYSSFGAVAAAADLPYLRGLTPCCLAPLRSAANSAFRVFAISAVEIQRKETPRVSRLKTSAHSPVGPRCWSAAQAAPFSSSI